MGFSRTRVKLVLPQGPAGPSCPPLPPALEAKLPAAKEEGERDRASFESPQTCGLAL